MKAISETEILQEGKMIQFYRRMFMERENNLITEQGSADIEDDTCASSLPENIVRRTIEKTTYVVSLHFKEQGQTFAQKLKRVLKADCSAIL